MVQGSGCWLLSFWCPLFFSIYSKLLCVSHPVTHRGLMDSYPPPPPSPTPTTSLLASLDPRRGCTLLGWAAWTCWITR